MLFKSEVRMKYRILAGISLCFFCLAVGCSSDNLGSSSTTGLSSPVDQFSDFTSSTTSCQPTGSTGAISGTVKESAQGFPIWGAKVTATQPGFQSEPTFSNEQGAYKVCGLSPGTYQVSASATGFEASNQSTSGNVLVQAGVDTQGIDLVITLASQQPPSNVGGVKGRVVSAQSSGLGIEGVHVEAWVNTEINNNQIASGQKVSETLTNDQGEFFLTLDIGAYTLAVYKEGFSPNPRLIIGVVISSDSVTILSKDISLFPG
jgi:hypothetical protein